MSDSKNDSRPAAEREPGEKLPLEQIAQQETFLTGQRRLANYGIIAISIIAILTGIHLARSVLTPIFIAAFFAVILYSFYAYMRERGIFGIRFSRVGAVIVIACFVIFFSSMLVMVLSTQLAQFSKRFPDYWNSFSEVVIKSNNALIKRNIELKEIFDFIPFLEKNDDEPSLDEPVQETRPALPAPEEAEDQAAAGAGDFPAGESSADLVFSPHLGLIPDEEDEVLPPVNIQEAPEKVIQVSMKMIYRYFIDGLGMLMSFVSMIFLVVLLLVFMLVEAIHLPEKVKAAIGDQENERVISTVAMIRKYMTIKTVVSAIVAVSVMILLLATEIEYWALWGLLAFFLNFIPNIGSIVAAIPPVLIAVADKGRGTIFAVILGYLLINCIIGYFLEPKLLGDGLGISALVVLLSLIVWGALLGSVGMLLSPPLAVICKIILSQFDETRWIAVLMAGRPPASPEQKPALPPPAPTPSSSD